MASGSTNPAEGERRAMVGYTGQYALAAQTVMAYLPSLEWIRVADPSAGAADDFQFKANGVRHAIQVKWSHYPGVFSWADLTSPGDASSLIGSLADAWSRISHATGSRPRIHLRTNDNPHSDPRRPPTAFAAATTTAPKHFAAFLATSMDPAIHSYRGGEGTWEQILASEPHAGWDLAWEEFRAAVGLPDGDDFPNFLADLQLEFHPLMGDASAVERPTGPDPDLEHLAAQLQRLVTLPSRKVEYTKKELLAELGWTGRAEFRNLHQFPMPIEYGANTAAYDALLTCVASHDSGYVALVGPAGCGKSTLLQDLETSGRLVRYFSFVPDSVAPFSSRGEAVSFLHDLTLSLELAGLGRPNAPGDLAGYQSCLRQQIKLAGNEFLQSGRRTVIIIDGIDHISREQHPTQSLVEVLPAPASLPPGVVLVIGSQTLNDLPDPIRVQLKDVGRTVELPPLSGSAVTRVVELAGLDGTLRPHQLARAIKVSEGHALSLRYLIEELKAVSAEEDLAAEDAVDAILDTASSFGGDVERRYRGYLAASEADDEVMRILAITSRLRAPVDVRWVSSWSRPDALRRFERHARPYFRVDGPVWRFVHNSFRIFLARETARAAGAQDAAREQQIESEIADICAATGDDWRVYRDEELLHRQRAGQVEKVLERTRPSVLRGQLEALRPSGLVRSDLMVGLNAAADRMDTRALIAGLQFSAELAIRDDLLPPERLAEALVDTSPRRPDLPQILNSSQAGLPWATSMRCSVRLVQRGAIDQAQEVLRASGGLVEARQQSSQQDAGRAVRDWAYSVCAISGHEAVIELVARHLSGNGQDDDNDGEPDPLEHWRSVAYAGATDYAGDLQDDSALDALGDVIMSDEPLPWRLRYLARRASAAVVANDHEAAQAWFDRYVTLRREAPAGESAFVHIDMMAAVVSVRLGGVARPEFRELIPERWLPAWPDLYGRHTEEWRAYAAVVMARSLQLLRQWVCRDSPAPDLPALPGGSDPGLARYLQALSALADHYASQMYAEHVGTTQPAWTSVDPVFRLLEVPSGTTDWHGWYRVTGIYSDLLKEFIRNCSNHGGSGELARLFEHFQSIWAVPERARFWPARRRLQVMEGFLDADRSITKPLIEPALDQLELLLGSIEDDEDAIECALLAAGLWSRCGRDERVQPMLEYAVRRSCSSRHYDESNSLLAWANWLLALPEQGKWPNQYSEFVGRLETCDRSLSTDATGPLVRGAWARDRSLACTSAEWFCTSGLMSEREAVEALVLEMCADTMVPTEIVASIASEMLLPITTWPADETIHALSARVAGTPWAEVLEIAESRWRPALAADEPHRQDNSGDAAADSLDSVPPHQSEGSYQSAAAILDALRRCVQADEAHAIDLLAADVHGLFAAAPPLVLRAILKELHRLGISGPGVGLVVGHAITAGIESEALTILQDSARNLPVEGWRPNWDGGSRLKLFEAACRLGGSQAKSAAASDLIACISGSRYSMPSIATTLRIARMLGGEQAVVDGWEDAQPFLDVYAPAQVPLEVGQRAGLQDDPVVALLSWVSQYLSHPVRDLDFGARAVLRRAVLLMPSETQTVLTAAIRRGPQIAEAALDLLQDRQIPGTISGDFAGALKEVVMAPDQIDRILAKRVADAHNIPIQWPPERALPGFYSLELPPLPGETPSPLGPDNMPIFDPAHPEHRLQPYDDLLSLFARAADLDVAVVLNHAASQNIDPAADWMDGGVQGLKTWLGGRGQRHMFRPWAFMHGRRSASRVFAELGDAQRLSLKDIKFFGELLIASGRQFPEPEPMDPSVPLPWRTPGTRDYDMTAWLSESDEAATGYRNYYAHGAGELIMAESAEWISSNSGSHREFRKVLARRPAKAGPILMPLRQAWEDTTLTPAIVALGAGLDWRSEELILQGWDRFGDGPLVTSWLAFHPVAAKALSWTPNRHGFEWIGTDGMWRARSRRVQRGSTTGDGQLPSGTYCGGAWQVIVSEQGWDEILSRWPVVRSLEIKRESGEREHPTKKVAAVTL